jgi:hypothetical protein
MPHRVLVGVLLLTAVASLVGCSKKDSLIVVTVTTVANASATNLHVLELSAGGTSNQFTLTDDITANPVTVGLYVPSSLTGPNIGVNAQSSASSTACYSGGTTVTIPAAGSTVAAQIIMNYNTACAPIGGTGGTTGTGGKGGTGGTSGSGGTTGTGGGLGTCVEIDHGASGTCASCTTGGTGDTAVFGVAFSPTNPQLVVTGCGNDPTGVLGNIKVWNIGANGALTAVAGKSFSGSGLNIVAFSPDGSALAIGRTGEVDIMRVSDWSASSTVTLPNGGYTYGVGFSPDATLLIVLSVTGSTLATSTGTLYAFPSTSPTTPFTATIPEGFALGVSPVTVGGVLPVAVTSGTGYTEVFNLTANGFSAPATVAVTSNSSLVETAAFAPHGDVMASGGDDGILNFWPVPVTNGHVPDSSPINIAGGTFSTQVWAAAFSPNEQYIAVAGGGFTDTTGFGSLSLWLASAPRAPIGSNYEFDTLAGYDVSSVAYSPSGNLIVAGEANCGCVIVCPQ